MEGRTFDGPKFSYLVTYCIPNEFNDRDNVFENLAIVSYLEVNE